MARRVAFATISLLAWIACSSIALTSIGRSSIFVAIWLTCMTLPRAITAIVQAHHLRHAPRLSDAITVPLVCDHQRAREDDLPDDNHTDLGPVRLFLQLGQVGALTLLSLQGSDNFVWANAGLAAVLLLASIALHVAIVPVVLIAVQYLLTMQFLDALTSVLHLNRYAVLLVGFGLLNSVLFLIFTWTTPLRPRHSIGFDGASLLSVCTFWWVMPTLRHARRHGSLELADLPVLSRSDTPEHLEREFLAWFGRQSTAAMTPLSLLIGTSFTIQRRVFFESYLTAIVFLACMFTDPIVINRLLQAEDSSSSDVSGRSPFLLVAILSLSMLLRVTCMEVCYFHSTRVANNVRTALVQAIFNKSIRNGAETIDVGKLTNLMSTDTDMLGQWAWGVFFLAQWTWSVISLPFVIYFLHDLVGNGAFIAIGCLLTSAVSGRVIGKWQEKFQVRLQQCRDVRSTIMKQFLASVKVTKHESIEEWWRDRLMRARQDELIVLARIRYLNAFNGLLGSLLALSVPVSIFSWRTIVDMKPLDAAVAFSALAWIVQMQWSISTLPAIFNAWAALSPSLQRIAMFLSTKDPVDMPTERVGEAAPALNVAIGLANLSTMNGTLRDLNLTIVKGSLVVVIGPTGSGKSSLISAIAGSYRITPSSSRYVEGTRSFVKQRPFLLSATIRDNVLFGMPLDQEQLDDVLKRTELLPDLAALPAGIHTHVGQNGVQLSGGQKARVCLARALYCNAELVLLDDVLSAVDRTTGLLLWANVIAHLRQTGRTVVLATHQMQFLTMPDIDLIVHMDNGAIVASGSYSQLMADNRLADQVRFLSADQAQHKTEPSVLATETGYRDDPARLSLREVRHFIRGLMQSLKGKTIDDALITDSITRHLEAPRSTTVEDQQADRKSRGSVTWADFRVYLKEFGSLFGALGILICVVVVLSLTGISSNVWLSIWTSRSVTGLTQKSYLAVYVAVGAAEAMLICAQTLVLTYCSLGASKALHSLMVQRILHAPMAYFDSHSSGLILNRFLSDLAGIDGSVPSSILNQLSQSLAICSQIALIVVLAPFVFLVLPLLVMVYAAIFRTVRIASRDTRRIESSARSPVYDLFSDVLQGKETIQCFQAEDRFEAMNRRLVENMSAAKVGNEAVLKWAQALTTQSSCFLYFATGVVGIFLVRAGDMTLGNFGVVLLYAAILQRAMMDYMMGLTNLETNFVAVERVAEITRIAAESTDDDAISILVSPSDQTHDLTWPANGKLVVQNVGLRYAINRMEVLRGVTISVDHGLKVAVIGRTGCGKSSLVSALSSLYPTCRGDILIDDVSIRSLPIGVVRRAVRVIPQDPVLLDASIRDNVRLCDTDVTDDRIWTALHQARLAGRVKQLGGLDHVLLDSGIQLSCGERQLLCIARALSLGVPKLLLCDEPTANIDLATDDLILQVLLDLDSTVLMIMHRLEHLTRFDRILLLDQGNVVAYGPPSQLMKDEPNVRQFLQRH